MVRTSERTTICRDWVAVFATAALLLADVSAASGVTCPSAPVATWSASTIGGSSLFLQPTSTVPRDATIVIVGAADSNIACYDSKGNAYNVDTHQTSGCTISMTCSAKISNPLTPSDTIGITYTPFSPVTSSASIIVQEWLGLVAAPLDRVATANGNSDMPSSGNTLLRTVGPELLVGSFGLSADSSCGSGPYSFSAPAGWTAIAPFTPPQPKGYWAASTYRPVSVTGTDAAVGILSRSVDFSAGIATYVCGSTCGNALLEPGESCDDGNLVAGDCCSPICTSEPGGGACAGDGRACTEDACDGLGACAHVPRPAGTECRAAVGACDAAEACNGADPDCPLDALLTGTECRPAAGACDLPEICDGTTVACPADAYRPNMAPCRVAADTCDVAELCDGVTPFCPNDGFVSAGITCRAPAGVCDVAEACDGAAASCPADAFAAGGTVCRASAGVCDVAESCDGATANCPSNAVVPPATVCRVPAGPCDVAESCDGTTADCPSDAVAVAGTVCRAAAADCDRAESCNGAATACPSDDAEPDGAECDDSDPCTQSGSCAGGVCIGSAPLDCDDGNPCSRDTCVPHTGCAHDDTPAADCRVAGKSLLRVTQRPDRGSSLLWKWTRGEAAAQADWGDAVTVCVYAGSTAALAASMRLPDGAIYWRPISTSGWKFRDDNGAPDGIERAALTGGKAGRSKMIVKGSGANLPDILNAGGMALPVRLQMRSTADACFESTFLSATINDGTKLIAKSLP